MARETTEKNYFYKYINTQAIIKIDFYQYINAHEIIYSKNKILY